MKTILQFEQLRIVLRQDTVYVEAECDNCGGHGIDSVEESNYVTHFIERCAKCEGKGYEVLYTENLGIDMERRMD